MIKNRWVFEDKYETQILHRHDELQSLSRSLGRTEHGLSANDVLIHGPSGVGKTASARYMLRNLRQQWGLEWSLIECSDQTCNGILHEAITRHRNRTVVHRNQPRADLLEALDDVVSGPYVLMLDEADVIPDLGVLRDLYSIDGISVIAITHSDTEWLSRVDRNIQPRFHGDSQVPFQKYHVDELVDILEPRVEHGLIGQPIDVAQLEWIADETGGVARWAIKSVLAAAKIADERHHDTILDKDIEDSFDRAMQMIRKDNLRSLPVPYLRLYELVRAIGPVDGSEMRAAYDEHQEMIFEGRDRDPVTWRRAWDYLAKMADYDLLEMPGETNSKVYEVIDPELEAPVDFEIDRAVVGDCR
ncbi:Cdc6/Cdc18 family protein [Natrarchaeobaculum sulfurireducens]|uniref:Cdc6-related protein, AAA superfamily ATPase n=1 Tax=Natrarchaeobaculum sulfurireducens TaxID=2044521 RepID=A0A346PHH9_9EURY|nr:AAA family ATPase [Natrarchaeobaculum sulfurireducens]AXR78974.1 Cdc6-related protein, AAA superfamily ATPase [Natrarchaeobaculum sulfurireducens]